MKNKYFYKLLVSHISIVITAFLILSLLFSQLVQNFIFQNKVEELGAFGKQILEELTIRFEGDEKFLREYSKLLDARKINYFLFDKDGRVVYPKLPRTALISLTEEEWGQLSDGKMVSVKQDLKRFETEVTLVALPYMQDQTMTGGVLLVSPISGAVEIIGKLNKLLVYTIIISLTASILISGFLSKSLVRRIKLLRNATSMISFGNYKVHIQEKGADEIDYLAKDFNEMAVRLQASSEQIESLENRRRKFIADVSHEMRTPLTTISGLVEGIRNDLIPNEEKEKGMDLIDRETKRLIRLVNENLDYERIRSNQVKLNKEEIDLQDAFEIVQEQLAQQAIEKNNQLIVEVEEGLNVFADYDRLTQILINIVKNSIQFTDNGVVRMRGKRGYKETIIEIEDSGIGMAPEEVENIWVRFYKADLSRTSNKFGEFGLGLSIVKQLVQLHQGEIQVTSSENTGTRFMIRLPNK
ncbi:HAMP domain-containing histidine kinase [Cytobacillus spongiae]|uniref:sensor histidine kinase n=1 Tax=Cytobacillus spongiae TaxID=2901381 RepID=UPI001F18DB02|nr:HAMP domain-containing sensor histidine kinase [Cytobacillus spongiae]UII57835.1 HAMP domain-containing histidine kinase [Cytobacillus spongiae]